MAFEFSLAAVLRIRGIIEEREEGILQKILFDIAQAFETLERADMQLAQSDASRVEELLKPSLGRQVHAAYSELRELKERREELATQIRKLELARDGQLLVYEAARRDREMLTDMREKKRTAYESDINRREQKTLDDNYIARRDRT
jgi:flagellar export protein FliJ